MSEQEEVNSALRRFTPRARQSLNLAQKEAEQSNHDCISVEHLLRKRIRGGGGAKGMELLGSCRLDRWNGGKLR